MRICWRAATATAHDGGCALVLQLRPIRSRASAQATCFVGICGTCVNPALCKSRTSPNSRSQKFSAASRHPIWKSRNRRVNEFMQHSWSITLGRPPGAFRLRRAFVRWASLALTVCQVHRKPQGADRISFKALGCPSRGDDLGADESNNVRALGAAGSIAGAGFNAWTDQGRDNSP
jgi:hypothetical protein